MLNFQLTDRAALRLPEERDAPELYALVDRNRAYLSRWMGWAHDDTEQNTLEFIRSARRQLADNDGLNTLITVDGTVAGNIGMVDVSWRDRSTHIGYWLAEEHQGAGIMTAGVRAYLDYAFHVLELNRVEIDAAVENRRSRAIPERLGFTNEGTLREAGKVGDAYQDMVVYAMVASDWRRERA